MPRKRKKLPLLSRRLRRIQDALELTDKAAAQRLGIPYSTYRDALHGYHLPRGAGAVLVSDYLADSERKLKLEPMQ